MSDGTETCTPEERRLLDLMGTSRLNGCEVRDEVGVSFHFLCCRPGGNEFAHELLRTLYDARGNRD